MSGLIVTVTPNPAIDISAQLESPARRGEINRVSSIHAGPGGKGINVSYAATSAGVPTIAVIPAPDGDPLLDFLRRDGVDYLQVAIDQPVRTNLAYVEADGTTTKFNEPGVPLGARELAEISSCLAQVAGGADWVVFGGSLPPGTRPDAYAAFVSALRQTAPQAKIAVDTCGTALAAFVAQLDRGDCAPDLLKPNTFELAELTGSCGQQLEDLAMAGDFSPTITAARSLIARGIPQLLVTVGAAGAVLVTATTAIIATPPPIVVISTVGAGDSSLAGFCLAEMAGKSPAECVRQAVAYGSAAAALPGTGIPHPAALDLAHTTVRSVPLAPRSPS